MLLIFLPSENNSRKLSQIPSTMSTALKILKPSRTPGNFTTQQTSGVPTLPPDEITTNKTSQITSSVPIDKPSESDKLCSLSGQAVKARRSGSQY